VRDLDDSTVDNEAYCRHLVATAGLPAAITMIEEFAGVRVLVAERFDRVSVGKRVMRLHQEDGCRRAHDILVAYPWPRQSCVGVPRWCPTTIRTVRRNPRCSDRRYPGFASCDCRC